MPRITPTIVLALVCLLTPLAGAKGLIPDEQRAELLTNPIGIDEANPRLSWTLSTPVRGSVQSAYRVLVASSEEKLADNEGDLWDTGKTESDAMRITCSW